MEDAVRMVRFGGLTPLEAIRATKFCVTRQALVKQLDTELYTRTDSFLPPLPPPPRNIATRNTSQDMSSVSISECSPEPVRTRRCKRRKVEQRCRMDTPTVVTNPEKVRKGSVCKETTVKLDLTQKQKLNLKLKIKKAKEDEQYSLAMAEAVFKYQVTINLRKENKQAKGLRKIIEEVNTKFMKKQPRKITRGSVQRYYQAYADNNNTDIKAIAELFKPKVPGPKLKVPPVVIPEETSVVSHFKNKPEVMAKLKEINWEPHLVLLVEQRAHIQELIDQNTPPQGEEATVLDTATIEDNSEEVGHESD